MKRQKLIYIERSVTLKPGDDYVPRPAFLAGIKPCDVIICIRSIPRMSR